jgi:hypothetical protein
MKALDGMEVLKVKNHLHSTSAVYQDPPLSTSHQFAPSHHPLVMAQNEVTYSRKRLRKDSSMARGIGPSASRKNLLNRTQDEIDQRTADGYSKNGADLINPDEFEEIAEIYDSIRLLHSKANPEIDRALAADFDAKLREVMETLSQTVNSDILAR